MKRRLVAEEGTTILLLVLRFANENVEVNRLNGMEGVCEGMYDIM